MLIRVSSANNPCSSICGSTYFAALLCAIALSRRVARLLRWLTSLWHPCPCPLWSDNWSCPMSSLPTLDCAVTRHPSGRVLTASCSFNHRFWPFSRIHDVGRRQYGEAMRFLCFSTQQASPMPKKGDFGATVEHWSVSTAETERKDAVAVRTASSD